MEMNQFTFGDGRAGGLEQVDMSINHKVSKVRSTSTYTVLCIVSPMYSTKIDDLINNIQYIYVYQAETMSIPELSRIYPTPPSVEMELDKFDEIKEERMDGTSIVLSTPAPQWDTDLVGLYTV